METYPNFLGYNCRITAYSLFAHNLEIPDDASIRDDMLMMDFDSLSVDRSAIDHEVDLNKFLAFYSYVPTDNTQDINVHLANYQKDLKERKIKFIDNKQMSMVSVLLHDQVDGDRLFVGHVGVLFAGDDEKLYFLEKIAFQEPYQLCVFNSRAELSDYLMAKYDTSFNQTNAAPMIIENGHLIEGYRNHSSK